MCEAVVATVATGPRQAFGADLDQLLDDRCGRQVHAGRRLCRPRRMHLHRLGRFKDASSRVFAHLVERHARAGVREVEILIRGRLAVDVELAAVPAVRDLMFLAWGAGRTPAVAGVAVASRRCDVREGMAMPNRAVGQRALGMIRVALAAAVVTATGCTPMQPISQSLYGEHYYTCCTLRCDEDRNNSDANHTHPFKDGVISAIDPGPVGG